MKIAIISDIHANYQALKTVFADIEKKGVDKVVCLGDIIGKGINARKCIDLVKEKCDVILRGNTDDRFSQNADNFKNDIEEYERIKHNQSLLNDDDLKFLSQLPLCYEIRLSGNLVRFFHAHPESPYKTVNNYNMNFNEKYQLFCPTEHTDSHGIADIVIFGHVHYQFMEKIYNRTIVNSGSVGCPGCLIFDEELNAKAMEIRQAHYVIIDGTENCEGIDDLSISFQSVEYDIEREFEDNKESPEKESYYDELFNAKYRGISKAMGNLKNMGYKF